MSGQTFFAAVNYIFDRQIPLSIFENVVNSPWDKMKEYITGVLPVTSLSQSPTTGKMIQSKKTGGKDDTDLVFSYCNNGTLKVKTVPRSAGIHLGAVLLKVRTHDGRERSVQHVANGALGSFCNPLAPPGSPWLSLAPPCSSWLLLVPPGPLWLPLAVYLQS
jgi:hypothetical protein